MLANWLRSVVMGVVMGLASVGPVLAAPTISLFDLGDGVVKLQITTDAPGALAAELALETAGAISLTGATINTALFDDPNPGDSPYIEGSPEGGDAEGLVFEPELNRLFAAFGSEDPGVGTHDFLTFEYESDFSTFPCTGSGLVSAFGLVSQDGVLNDGLSITEPIGPAFFTPGGDFDGDCKVGSGDLDLLLLNWGAPVPPVPEGWVGSQPTFPSVGSDELDSLLLTFGQGSALASVPEPGALSLALLTICGGARRRDG